MKKLRRRAVGSRRPGSLRDWSLPRQLIRQDVMAEAAESTTSRTLRPRLEQADRVGTSICPFCAVGCAQLVYARNGKPIHIEGDPRSPVNQGTLCPKGAGTLGMMLARARVNHVCIARPMPTDGKRSRLTGRWSGSPQRVKQTRDETFVEDCRTARWSTTR